MASSFLSFAWRRRQASETALSCDEERDGPPLSPRCNENEQAPLPLSRCSSEETDHQAYYKLQIVQQRTPHTPEGLRPQKNRSVLGRELGLTGLLVPENLEKDEPLFEAASPPPVYERLFEVTSPSPTDPSFLPFLPPRDKTKSWSTTGVLNSPPVSTSSFYGHSRDGTERIAVSPNLLPGQARTAVGNLVAIQQQQQQEGGILPALSDGRIAEVEKKNDESSESHEVQVPEKKPLQYDWQYVRHNSKVSSPHRKDGQNSDTSGSVDENEHPAYHNLDDDPITNSRTPPRLGVRDNKKNRSLIQHTSPISHSSSLLGSPSSRAGLLRDRFYQKKPHNASMAEYSYNDGTRHILPQQNARYDFGPLVGGTLTTEEDAVNLSAMSEQESHVSRRILHGENSSDGKSYMCDRYQEIESTTPLQLDAALRKSKLKQQRRSKELLIVQVMERLRDDLQVIADVEAVDGIAVGVNDWLVKTPLNEPGLLTGFSEATRTRIRNTVSCILNAMEVAQPEEFFLSSPTEVPDFAEPHDDLKEALQFCFRLVDTSFTSTETHKDGHWRFEGRSNLGIIPPESPEVVRGGDTSLFSLPSDSCAETPMTSNVSLGTTITSVNSPQRVGRRMPRKAAPNGLVVRRTIEIFSTLMQHMTVACLELVGADDGAQVSSMEGWNLDTEKSVRITETLKRTYLQLLAMETSNLRAVADSFELVDLVIQEVLTGTLDDEDNDDLLPIHNNFVLPPPPIVGPRQTLLPECGFYFRNHPPTNRSDDIFSPSTEDMRTVDHVDDLRRQFGSNDDCEDQTEERDDPPMVHPALQAMDCGEI